MIEPIGLMQAPEDHLSTFNVLLQKIDELVAKVNHLDKVILQHKGETFVTQRPPTIEITLK